MRLNYIKIAKFSWLREAVARGWCVLSMTNMISRSLEAAVLRLKSTKSKVAFFKKKKIGEKKTG